MTRILLVEDEPTLVRALSDNFRDEGWEVHVEGRGDRAVAAVTRLRPDCVVLDVMLPGLSGHDVLRELRSRGDEVPVLMLTARAELVDRVLGLELGADDYLGKPFARQELLARVRALLRRSRGGAGRVPDVLVVGRARFDFAGLRADGADGTLPLSARDVLVLRVLAQRRGEVVSRADIVEEVAGLESDSTQRTVDNHVVALRRAIGDDPRRPRFLQTVRGIGYRLVLPDGA